MPLKETDLKDPDTYKKAIRVDLPKIASGTAKFWIYKDVELPNSSGKKQKYPAFLVLVDDNGIHKAMTGKKVICKGTCSMKDERIAFEPSSGAVPYGVLKASVPLLLGKAVWIPTGMEDARDEGEAGESAAPGTAADASIPAAPAPPAPTPAPPAAPPPAPPPPKAAAPVPHAPEAPPLSAAALTGPWTKLVKDVQAYAAAHPERKAEMFRDMGDIAALLKANKAAEAKPKMDKLQAALDAPAPPPQAAAGPAQAAARWSALVKEMQAAVAANPEKKADLVRASAGIAEMIRVGKIELANKLMDTVDQTLKANPREKEYRARYQALEGKLAAALKDPARDPSRLRAMNAFLVEKANAGDFETAMKALLKLEEALSAKPAAVAGEAKPGAEQGKEKEEQEEEEAAEPEDEEEEKEAAEFQKDLRGKMVAAMTQVRTRAPREGEDPKPQLQFAAYLAGKSSSVIVARKVGGGSKRVLAQIAGASGGKIVQGECIFEKGVHTFVLAAVPGGLAKKLTVALLSETGTKYRVRVRSIDGAVDLDSETDVDPDAVGDPTAEWRVARQATVDTLRKLVAAVSAEDDPDSAKAVILLDSIVKNLTPSPDTQQSVTELLNYLQTDDVIVRAEAPNPFDVPVVIRGQLLPVLERLQAQLPA